MPVPTMDMGDALKVARMGGFLWGEMEEPWPGFFACGTVAAGSFVIDGAHLTPEAASALMQYADGQTRQITPSLKPVDGFFRSSSMNHCADIVIISPQDATTTIPDFDRQNTIFLFDGPSRCLAAVHAGFLAAGYTATQAIEDFDRDFARSSHESMEAREAISEIE